MSNICNYSPLGTISRREIDRRFDTIHRHLCYVESSVGTAVWGSISGTLSDQTDLQTALNAKQSTLTFSTGLTNTTNTVTANLSTGVAGGQSVIGGTASGNNLTLSSTSNGTKGKIILGSSSAYDEVNDRLGIGQTTPTAAIHIKAGTTTASTAPLKFTSGSLLTTAEAGAVEFLTDKAYLTITTGAARKELALVDVALTSGRVPFSTTNGRLIDSANFTYSTNRLSPTYITLAAGTATAGTAPLYLTSGTNLTTAETGAFEYNGTNLFFTRTGTTRESVLTGNSGASAPATAAAGTVTNRYGGATNFLGDPNSWASVVIGGVTYKLPLYT